jgi:hypothetical protein
MNPTQERFHVDRVFMSSLPIDQQAGAASLRLSDPAHSPPPASNEEATPAHPGVSNPLSDAHLHQIVRAVSLAKPIEKAVRYAHFSGWTTLLAGAGSLPFALGNTPMLIFTICVAGIGTRELTLRRSLKVLDTRAPRKLAINQLVLGGALIAYAVFMLLSVPGEGMVQSAINKDPMMQSTPEISGMMDDMVQLEQLATAMMYVLMIAMAIFIQGGTALYYALKSKKLKKLHRQTPKWVVDVYQTVHR